MLRPACDKTTVILRSLYTAVVLGAFEEPTPMLRAQVDHATKVVGAVPYHAPSVASHSTTRGHHQTAEPRMVIRCSLLTAMAMETPEEPTQTSMAQGEEEEIVVGDVEQADNIPAEEEGAKLEEEEEEEPQADPDEAAVDTAEEGASSSFGGWFSGGINLLEKATGIDIDGDGDVGQP